MSMYIVFMIGGSLYALRQILFWEFQYTMKDKNLLRKKFKVDFRKFHPLCILYIVGWMSAIDSGSWDVTYFFSMFCKYLFWIDEYI